MLTIEKLKAYGANVDEGLSRCMNNDCAPRWKKTTGKKALKLRML